MNYNAQPKPRWFYLAHINCDCASYDHAWLRQFHSGEWPHCILCHKQLGDMEITYLGKFKAVSLGDAWEQQKAQADAKKAHTPTTKETSHAD